jgi:acetyltransferase/esterase
MDAQTLQVPGATLYYETRGGGPLLLLIPGGSGDAGSFERVAPALAESFTVVSYDRRGFARSPLDEPPDDARRLAADAADARRLIDELSGGPALVFGSSSGAIVGLDLLARRPGSVRTLVAHEPPLVTLLPDGGRHQRFFDEVYETYRGSGFEAAIDRFNTGIGAPALPRPPEGAQLPPHIAQMLARLRANLEFWLEHELRQYTSVAPDLTALKAAGDRLVLAGGRDSRELLPSRPNVVLAEQLGTEVTEFPGGHAGYVTDPEAFAARLTEVLSSAA